MRLPKNKREDKKEEAGNQVKKTKGEPWEDVVNNPGKYTKKPLYK